MKGCGFRRICRNWGMESSVREGNGRGWVDECSVRSNRKKDRDLATPAPSGEICCLARKGKGGQVLITHCWALYGLRLSQGGDPDRGF